MAADEEVDGTAEVSEQPARMELPSGVTPEPPAPLRVSALDVVAPAPVALLALLALVLPALPLVLPVLPAPPAPAPVVLPPVALAL